MDTRSITIASFCAGAGGLELGFRLVFPEARTVLYVEREVFACGVLAARFEEQTLDDAPVWTDASTFDGKPWCGLVDIFAAGFSCQPWSVAGSRLGTEDERWLWPDLAKRIAEMGPPVVFLENVPGLIHGHGIEHVLHDLAEMGYDAEWGSLSAGAVGASHERERLYILAWHAGWNARGLAILAHAVRSGQSGRDERGLREARREAGQHEDRTSAANESGDGSEKVGNSNLARRSADGTGCSQHAGNESQPGCEPVADTRREGLQWSERRGTPGSGHGTETSGPTTELRGPSVGDTGRQRGDGLQSVGQSGSDEATTIRESGSDVDDTTRPRIGQLPESEGRYDPADAFWSIPLFCPGPSDTEAWRNILTIAPGLKPALCRVADELADQLDFRADRLRLAGNGVVPLAAACAFTLLAARALK